MMVPVPATTKTSRLAAQDAAENVAAELVGAENVLARWRLQAFRELLLCIWVGRDRRAENGQ